jgi:3-methyladenine DNA glycosylase/8-oxoguanine DNA glycosylase
LHYLRIRIIIVRMNSQITSHTFSLEPSGPFDLANQNAYFGGWPTLPGDQLAIVMAFPVEGSDRAAAVVLRQPQTGVIAGEVHGCNGSLAEAAQSQALAAVSLDVDASGWSAVGIRDPVIGRLQAKYGYLRPTLFHSPYEAAAAFVIGHRISIRQTRALRARIASALGTAITLDGQRYDAFPTPAQLLAADELPGINPAKTERLCAIAHAAHQGWLARQELRAMSHEAALAKLQTLPGVGAFFSQAILHRGAGTVDVLAADEVASLAVTEAYGLKHPADQQTLEQIAEAWRPYRTWAAVLLHVWGRSELRLPQARRGRSANTPRDRTAPTQFA